MTQSAYISACAITRQSRRGKMAAMRVMRGMVNGAVSELSGGGAMREQAAAVTRDYLSQPRLSEYRGPAVPRESLLLVLGGAGKRPEWGGAVGVTSARDPPGRARLLLSRRGKSCPLGKRRGSSRVQQIQPWCPLDLLDGKFHVGWG